MIPVTSDDSGIPSLASLSCPAQLTKAWICVKPISNSAEYLEECCLRPVLQSGTGLALSVLPLVGRDVIWMKPAPT